MNDTPDIAAARIAAERHRGRLMAAAHELQHRLAPATLARSTWEGAKEKGADLAEEAVDAVRSRPLAATGVVAALTMFLAREPLMDLASKLVDGAKKTTTKRKKPAVPKAQQPQTKAKLEKSE